VVSKAQHFREQQAICLERALSAPSLDLKEGWERLAEQWGFLADDASRRERRNADE